MATSKKLGDAWEHVPCPTCQAATGIHCTTVTGLEMRLDHRDRIRRYAKKLLRNAQVRTAF